MKKSLFLIKTSVITVALSVCSSLAMAIEQANDFFLPNYSDTQMLAMGLRGKPPYHNRARLMKQQKIEKTARSMRQHDVEETELSAMEISEETDNPLTEKNAKKKFIGGHPGKGRRHSRR
jgi:hypothetical protein